MNAMKTVFLALLAATLAGCASGPTAVEEDFGNSVRAMIRGQTLDPAASERNGSTPPDVSDGQRAEGVLEAYRKDVSAPSEVGRGIDVRVGEGN